ncbi:MAG: hypothetical protein K0R27_883 [Xanthobacteraceae bacterium]|jgi:hypothetical protein|nr:hypothetical protein [Xanthobacteraceae bacterium]
MAERTDAGYHIRADRLAEALLAEVERLLLTRKGRATPLAENPFGRVRRA